MAHNSRQTATHNCNGFFFSNFIVIAICIATFLATNAFAESFTYDKAGNRINNGETYNANNELLQSGSATYTHDANGNVTSKTENGQTTTFIYDVRDKLAQVQLPDGRTITYNYDPFGRRIKKDLAGDVTYYVYSDEGLIGEYDESGNPRKIYAWQPDGVWGTNPVAMEQNSNTYYYQNDHLGTPQRLIDESGTTFWHANYSAFGQATVATNSTIENNLRFPGQYFDAETELHYNWNRYYNPQTGRYTQVDPIGFVAGDGNLYRYVWNGPLNWIDVEGLSGITLPLPGVPGLPIVYVPPKTPAQIKEDLKIGNKIEGKVKEVVQKAIQNIILVTTIIENIKNSITHKAETKTTDKCPNAEKTPTTHQDNFENVKGSKAKKDKKLERYGRKIYFMRTIMRSIKTRSDGNKAAETVLSTKMGSLNRNFNRRCYGTIQRG